MTELFVLMRPTHLALIRKMKNEKNFDFRECLTLFVLSCLSYLYLLYLSYFQYNYLIILTLHLFASIHIYNAHLFSRIKLIEIS